MKILWIAKVPPEIHSPRIWEVARRLVQRGHSVTILTTRTRSDLPARQTIDGVEVHYAWTAPRALRSGRLGFYLTRLPFYATGPVIARRLARTARPDVVIEDAAPAGCFMTPGAAAAMGVPLVIDVHHLFDSFGSWWRTYGPVGAWGALWERRLRGGSIRPALLASDSKPLLADLAVSSPHLRTVWLPNGVDLERFGRTRDRARTGPGERLEVIAVGRCVQSKGHRHLVEAAALLKGRFPFRVTIYGEGGLLPRLQEQARQLGVDDIVRFPGHVGHEEIHQAYADASLFVMPSLAEGLPLALIEAFGSGLPAVATTIPELVAAAPAGVVRLVAPADPIALAQAIADLAADPALRAEMGRRGRALAESVYHWRGVTDAFESALIGIVGR